MYPLQNKNITISPLVPKVLLGLMISSGLILTAVASYFLIIKVSFLHGVGTSNYLLLSMGSELTLVGSTVTFKILMNNRKEKKKGVSLSRNSISGSKTFPARAHTMPSQSGSTKKEVIFSGTFNEIPISNKQSKKSSSEIANKLKNLNFKGSYLKKINADTSSSNNLTESLVEVQNEAIASQRLSTGSFAEIQNETTDSQRLSTGSLVIQNDSDSLNKSSSFTSVSEKSGSLVINEEDECTKKEEKEVQNSPVPQAPETIDTLQLDSLTFEKLNKAYTFEVDEKISNKTSLVRDFNAFKKTLLSTQDSIGKITTNVDELTKEAAKKVRSGSFEKNEIEILSTDKDHITFEVSTLPGYIFKINSDSAAERKIAEKYVEIRKQNPELCQSDGHFYLKTPECGVTDFENSYIIWEEKLPIASDSEKLRTTIFKAAEEAKRNNSSSQSLIPFEVEAFPGYIFSIANVSDQAKVALETYVNSRRYKTEICQSSESSYVFKNPECGMLEFNNNYIVWEEKLSQAPTPQDILTKIADAPAIVRKQNLPEDCGIIKYPPSAENTVFEIPSIPGYVFKIKNNPKDDSQEAAEEYVNIRLKAKKICKKNNLYLFRIPNCGFFKVGNQHVIWEEKLPLLKHPEDTYEKIFNDPDLKTFKEECINQLAVFISKTQFGDVKPDNIPFTIDGYIAFPDLDNKSTIQGLCTGNGRLLDGGLLRLLDSDLYTSTMERLKKLLTPKNFKLLESKVVKLSLQNVIAAKTSERAEYLDFLSENGISACTQEILWEHSKKGEELVKLLKTKAPTYETPTMFFIAKSLIHFLNQTELPKRENHWDLCYGRRIEISIGQSGSFYNEVRETIKHRDFVSYFKKLIPLLVEAKYLFSAEQSTAPGTEEIYILKC